MQKYMVMLLIALVSFGGATSCKSKKKAAEKAASERRAADQKAAEAAKANQVLQAKDELFSLLEDKTKSASEKEAALAKIKAKNINDPEIKALIARVETQVAEAKQLEADKRIADEERKKIENAPLNVRLTTLLGQIAAAPNREAANQTIAKALTLFASPKVPVFKIIGVFNGEKDFDKPTDITQYLNYVKDQKKNIYKLQTYKTDANGKISELEMIIDK